MTLIVFDLDGTLLNRQSQISEFTRDTLRLLQQRDIAYTVATGRTLHAARELVTPDHFNLPQIYKNGVVTWDPITQNYSHQFLLSSAETDLILHAFLAKGLTPFIFTLDSDGQHAVYHTPLQTELDHRLAQDIREHRGLPVLPAAELPGDARITNVSALGEQTAAEAIGVMVESEAHLVAYMGPGIEDSNKYWLDVHHSDGSKGAAVARLKRDLGAQTLICFGDSDNDLSMFSEADECYAPESGKIEVKAAATAVIGHHDEDGVARFLRERFNL